MPQPTEEQWKKYAFEFQDIWNFPNCLAAIDGKHITIQCPRKSGSLYFNYKKTFSVVLLALVDANYNFIAVDVGSYGKNSDGGIFSHSNIGKALESSNFNIPEPAALPGSTIKLPYVIVGDEAFPLKSYLMRPYPAKQLTDSNRVFNYRLSRARRVVENGFGILVQRFRIFLRTIQLQPENVDFVILTTCILHNFIKKYEATSVDCTFNSESTVMPNLTNIPMQGGNAPLDAFRIREMFKEFFNSPVGSVPWQNEIT